MKNVLMALCLFAAVCGRAVADDQVESFTYQGRLQLNGQAANGSVPMTFKLFSAVTGGLQLGPTITDNAVAVSNGAFSKQLAYPGAFTGQQLWLEVAANGQTLLPRQMITAAPVAQFALNGARAIRIVNAGPSPSDSPQPYLLADMGAFQLAWQCTITPFGSVRLSVIAVNPGGYDAFAMISYRNNDTGATVQTPISAEGLPGNALNEVFGWTVAAGNFSRLWVAPLVIASSDSKETISLDLYAVSDARVASPNCRLQGTATLGR